MPDAVFQGVCSGFESPPEVCGLDSGVKDEGITGFTLIMIVVMLVGINLFLILLYRRCTNREMKEDMQLQVNSAVSQYFALSTR